MDLTTYFIVLLISSSGFLAGNVIGHLAKEELRSGRVYFKLLLVLLTAVLIFYFVKAQISHPEAFVPLGITIILMVSVRLYMGFNTFPLFFAFIYFQSRTQPYFVVVSGLILIYYLVAGTLFRHDIIRKVQRKEDWIAISLFPIIASILYFI